MAMYLDYYEQTFEAAKSFDDDLDFCPSLSPSELREIQKTRRTPTASPSGWRHHHQHHHHHHNHNQDKRRIPSSSLSYTSYPYSSSCSSSSEASSPSLSRSPSVSPPLSPSTAAAPTTSRAIAIVDPISRAPVQLPGAGTSSGTVTASSSGSSSATPSATSTVVGGYLSGSNVLSLPPPLIFHEPALATLDPSSSSSSSSSEASEASMLFPPSSPTFSISEDMMEGTHQFWMDFHPSVTTAHAQYFPYPTHPQDPNMNAFSSYSAPAPYPVHHYPGSMGGGPAGFVAVPMMMMGF